MKQGPQHKCFLKHSDIEEIHRAKLDKQPKKIVSRFLFLNKLIQRADWFQVISVFVATSIFWIVVLLVLRAATSHPSENITKDQSIRQNATSGMTLLTCGDSAAEAKKLGYKYDMELNNWVHPRCFDQNFIDDYHLDDSWTAFVDKELTQIVASGELGERKVYFTSERDHVNHCVMIWRRQSTLLFEQRDAIDDMSAILMHTQRCIDHLLTLNDGRRQHDTGSNSTDSWPGQIGCWVRQ